MVKCPSCGKEQREPSNPRNKWSYGNYVVKQYRCDCGLAFRDYLLMGKHLFFLEYRKGLGWLKMQDARPGFFATGSRVRGAGVWVARKRKPDVFFPRAQKAKGARDTKGEFWSSPLKRPPIPFVKRALEKKVKRALEKKK